MEFSGIFHNKFGNDKNKALNAFLKCKKIDKNFNLVDFNIGCNYMDNKDYLSANDKFLKKSIKKNPNHTASYLNLAVVQQNIDKYEEAIKYYDELLKIDPNTEDIVFANLTNIYREIGKLDKAAYYSHKLIKKNENYIQAYISYST